jgi:hypothetical protein
MFLACALARRGGLGGGLFQFSALALGLDRFGCSLFPMRLRVNAELPPGGLRKIDAIVVCSLRDVGEGQSAIFIGDADIEPRDGVPYVPGVGQRVFAFTRKGKDGVGLFAFRRKPPVFLVRHPSHLH